MTPHTQGMPSKSNNEKEVKVKSIVIIFREYKDDSSVVPGSPPSSQSPWEPMKTGDSLGMELKTAFNKLPT